jgi:hypothetical protein
MAISHSAIFVPGGGKIDHRLDVNKVTHEA